mgnify:CR=1 FL=1
MNSVEKKYMNMVIAVGQKSNCFREDRKVGAVIVKNNKVLGSGCNEVPKQIKDCCSRGQCMRKTNKIKSGMCLEKCYSLCAEQYAIIDALKKGEDLEGATIYTTLSPCALCARWIIVSGIKKIVYKSKYIDPFSESLLTEAGIKVKSIE